MNKKSQKIICAIAFFVAALAAIPELTTTITIANQYGLDQNFVALVFSVLVILLEIAAGICCLIGGEKGVSIGCLLVAPCFIYQFIDNIRLYSNLSSGKTSAALQAILPSYILSAVQALLIVVASILIFVAWQKGTQKNTLRLIAGILAIAGIVCEIARIAILSIAYSSILIGLLTSGCLNGIAICIALFIASRPLVNAGLSSNSASSNQSNKTNPATSTPVAPTTDQLAEYKQLLNAGTITQEEFDEQKRRFMEAR